jgi:hypothetical protein
LSVETIRRLTPAVLGSTVFSIAGLRRPRVARHGLAVVAGARAVSFLPTDVAHRLPKNSLRSKSIWAI